MITLGVSANDSKACKGIKRAGGGAIVSKGRLVRKRSNSI
jgi:hypothetical protein